MIAAARSFLIASVLLFTAGAASAVTIEILDIGDSGTTNDGTVFAANPNPSDPSTGTGVFQPFVRIEALGNSFAGTEQQLGMNTNTGEPTTNFDTKGGSDWTRAVKLGELGTITQDGVTYYEFLLDANEEGSATSLANQILLTDVQIYLGSDDLFSMPEASLLGVDGTGYTGTPFDSTDNSLLNTAPVWTLDSGVNGDVTVVLQSSICSSPGQCGSGKGDMSMLVPVSEIQGDPDDWFVFYTEYDLAARPSGGFEEWKANLAPIPEPSSALVFGVGLLVAGASRRRKQA